MARLPSAAKHHRPKDFCTIEQAEYIAERAAVKILERYHAEFHAPTMGQRADAALERNAWYRRLWRWLAA